MRNNNYMKLWKTILIRSLIVLIVIGITAFVIYISFKSYGYEFVNTLIITISCEAVIGAITICFQICRKIVNDISNNKAYVYNKKYENEKIRLSFSYLIRIKVNNRYLLVKGGHKRNLFGPIGGVYHIDHIDYIYKTLGFSRDSTPGDSNDIRGTILGKNIKAFIKWFDKAENREKTQDREFKEEFLNSNLIDSSLFNEPSFKYVCTKYKGVSYGDYYGINELLRFDIYDLILNDTQTKALKNLNKKTQNLCLFTKEEIKTLGITKDNDKRIIGTQTPYILED